MDDQGIAGCDRHTARLLERAGELIGRALEAMPTSSRSVFNPSVDVPALERARVTCELTAADAWRDLQRKAER